MSPHRKQVFRLDLWQHPVFGQRLAQEGDIDLTMVPCAAPESDIWAGLGRAHVYQVSSAKDELPRPYFVSAELLQRCPNLLCVSTIGAGFDTVDVAACTSAGVLVVNQSGCNANAVAEHALSFMLGLSRRINESDRRLRRELITSRQELMGVELQGQVLGLVGIGNIGTRVAEMARVFAMEVIATDPYLTDEEIARRGARAVSLEDLLAQSDIVSVHCPRDQNTINMMDAGAFAQMKRGALFLNTARGGIHNEVDLLAALQSGHLGGAGLDVWDVEPPPLDHPLMKLDNVIASFHTAGVTLAARRTAAEMAAEQIVGILKGGRPPRLINPEAWSAFGARFEGLLGGHVQAIPSSDE